MSEWMSETLTGEVERVAELVETRRRNSEAAVQSTRQRSWEALRLAAQEYLEPEVAHFARLGDEPPENFGPVTESWEVIVDLPGTTQALYARFTYMAGKWQRTDFGYPAWDDPDVATSVQSRWRVEFGTDFKNVRSLAAAVYYSLQGS